VERIQLMKYLSNFIILIFAILAFSSCEKGEPIDKKQEEAKTFELESFDGALAGVLPADDCYTFSYPIRYEMPDGSTIVLENDLDDELKDWYEENTETEQRPSLIFPIQVTFQDELIPVYNNDELIRIKEACEDKWDFKESCFNFIYPISFSMPDGSSVNLAADDDTGLKDWYEANPTSEERPSINYPIDINFKEEIITLNSDDELKRIKDACEDRIVSAEDICFNFVFPLSVNIGGEIITGENLEELRLAMKDWYDANPDAEIKPEFVYPIEIIFEDGTLQQLESDQDLREAKEAC